MAEVLPPHSLDSEQSVLGSILIDREMINEVAEFLAPRDFYRQTNGTIYRSMLALFERREPIDIVTVSEELERMGELSAIGGRAYLAEVSGKSPMVSHIAQYGRIVERHSVLRGLIGAAGKIAEVGYSGAEVREAIDQAEAELFAVSNRRAATAGFRPIKELLHEAYDRFDQLNAHHGQLTGIGSGFVDLDILTTGFQKSDLVIVAARPGVGKTSFALNVAEHAALRENRKVGIFSLEMSGSQLIDRLLSSVTGVDSKKMRSGRLDPLDFARIAEASSKLADAGIFIDDVPNLSALELRTKARRLYAKEQIDLLVVDYLQLMTGPHRDGNRAQEVSDISRGLKALARELNIPVIALSQLNRQMEHRTGANAEPKLSDLRESGAIEQDADLVIFLWRDDKAPPSSGEIVNLNLAKHRNGPTGDLTLWFQKHQTRFSGTTHAED